MYRIFPHTITLLYSVARGEGQRANWNELKYTKQLPDRDWDGG